MARKERKKTAQQYLTEDRRRQVAILITQSYSELEIAKKLGVDNSTISKDIKALKLISQQFIYDVTKSDFTFYYKQCLDAVKLILRKQWEIAEKEHISSQDMNRAKILSDILNTVATISEYYSAAPRLHKSPMQTM
jgi:IS30 family transposase